MREPGSTIPEIPLSKIRAVRSMIALSGAESMPASLDQFLAALRLLHRDRFDGLVNRLATENGTANVVGVAHELVRNKVLTPYQAAALCQGKGKELLVGPYEVLDRSGPGGMGMVYKAVHRKRRTIVALKVLPPSFARRSQAVVDRFRREAELLAGINHPNIVCYLEPVKVVDGVYYLVLEYVEGADLRSLVETKGRFPVAQAIECLLQTAKGLQVAHSRKIIHRDIKPANLMLDRTNTIRILDFGLARVMPLDEWLPVVDDETASRAMLGTIPYMAPEQATDPETADARSEIYSLGCTLHFLLTDRPPYPYRTRPELVLAHRQAPIPSLKAARPTVPDHLDDFFRQMLAKDPADRPQTMTAVVAELENALDKVRARPSSSHIIPIRPPDEPNPADFKSRFRVEAPKREGRAKSRRKEKRYLGDRLRPPLRPRDFIPLAKYLVLTVALIVVLIILIELLLLKARGAKPVLASTASLFLKRDLSPRMGAQASSQGRQPLGVEYDQINIIF
jgi:serine/threonine protein kinase